jgi:Rrf2 family protein
LANWPPHAGNKKAFAALTERYRAELQLSELLIAHQQLPRRFVEAILGELRRADLVRSQRGADGGSALARAPSKITIGSIIRAVD